MIQKQCKDGEYNSGERKPKLRVILNVKSDESVSHNVLFHITSTTSYRLCACAHARVRTWLLAAQLYAQDDIYFKMHTHEAVKR